MHRFYLPPDQTRGEPLVLRSREAHHALHVLRMKPGEPVLVLNGEGGVFDCCVETATRKEVFLRVVRQQQVARPPWQITIASAVAKTKSMEFLVQKAAELGAFRIRPLITERVVAHWDSEAATHRVDKWRAIAIESIKQCGSAWLPQIDEPIPLPRFLTRLGEFDLALVAALHSDARHPREHLASFWQRCPSTPVRIAVCLGPEGDFTGAELEAVRAAGILPIHLGPLILRCETAALYCLAALNYELQALFDINFALPAWAQTVNYSGPDDEP